MHPPSVVGESLTSLTMDPVDSLTLSFFFDFLIGVNGHRVDMSDPDRFFRTISHFKGQEVSLTFYNYKTEKTRFHKIIPNEDWGGSGHLGLQISNDCFLEREENVVRIKKVTPNTTAAFAGLTTKDYFLGTDKRIISDIEVFRILLNQYRSQVVNFWVYNSEKCDIRKVAVTIPEGALGCEICDGFLNKIPDPKGKMITMRGRVLVERFQSEETETESVNPIENSLTSEPVRVEATLQEKASEPLIQPIPVPVES